MAIEMTIPEDLRRRIGDALQRSIPEQLSPVQLSTLSSELGEHGHRNLQRELFETVVGAVPSDEFSKQAEATERVNKIKSSLTSETDEDGRRHPSRAKHFLLLSAAVLSLVAFLIWNNMQQASARRPAIAQSAPEAVEEPAPAVPTRAPQVDLGTEEVAEPAPEPAPQTPEAPRMEPTVPAPSFGAKGAIYDTGQDNLYDYGGPGADLGGYGPDGYGQEAGAYAEVTPLQGGGGARLALAGGGGASAAQLAGGIAASGRLTGGAAASQTLTGGASGQLGELDGGGFAKTSSLNGGASMEGGAEPRQTALASYGSEATTSPPVTGSPLSTRSPNTRLSVPRVPAPRPPQPPSAARSSANLAPGALLRGEIEAAPVLATGLAEAPVSVKDEDGRIWLGVAKLAGASGRAMITLDEVVINGRLYRTKASVLSTDRVYGVKVQAKEVAPSIASSTLRAALGGVAEYVKGIQDATKVYTDADGNRIEEKTPPQIEWAVAKRLAEVFDLPIEEKAISRIFVIDSGQAVRILVRQTPVPADDAR